MNIKALRFVDMPVGRKPDLKSDVVVDFDQICNDAIKPAIEDCSPRDERTHGIIHSAMFPGCCDPSYLCQSRH